MPVLKPCVEWGREELTHSTQLWYVAMGKLAQRIELTKQHASSGAWYQRFVSQLAEQPVQHL